MTRHVTPEQGSNASDDALATAPAGTNAHYERLRQEIVSGLLRPGAPLHEVAVSTRLGVSRAPVRDAIIRLEADGLVERGPRGTVIRTRTADEIFDIYQARIALEAEAAESATRRSSELDRTRMAMIIEQARSEQDPPVARALHARWHRTLAVGAHNQTVLEILDRLVLQLAPYETESLAQGPNRAHTDDEHTEILDAISSGDAAAARSVMTRHLQRTRDVRVDALLRRES